MIRHSAVCVAVTLLLAVVPPVAACQSGGATSAPTVPMVEVSALDAAPGSVAVGAGDGRASGDHVEVRWHGTWYRAVLLERRGPRWLIHYDGYGATDDEVVPLDRIRDVASAVLTPAEDDPEAAP